MATENAKIQKATITDMPKSTFDRMPEVWVQFEGEQVAEKLFSFFPDEISFSSHEFVGLTRDEAMRLFHKKDVAYLRS